MDRISKLKHYDILDTPPDGYFTHINEIICDYMKVPVSTVSLVDVDRIWFKSYCGLDTNELPAEPGLCFSAVNSDSPYIVNNARTDSRTRKNSLVTSGVVGFYLGIPLKTYDGYSLGVLTALDKNPREVSSEEIIFMEKMAKLVMDQMELRLSSRIVIKENKQLAYRIAHDLKSPISSIPIMTDFLTNAITDENQTEVTEMVTLIKSAATDSLLRINEFLQTSQERLIDTNKYKSLNLESLVKKVVDANKTLARHKNQTIKLRIIDEPTIYVDEIKIINVLDNIINNAIKYSYEGGKLTVKVYTESNMATVSVADNGQGLTTDDQKNIFKRFSVLSSTPTGDEVSSKIGLSFALEIILAHKGLLEVFSKGKNKGSTFVIKLPLYNS